jgi:hypothetical protein
MPAAAEVRIEGLRELNRALSKINKEVAKEVRNSLTKSAEPVRQTAESLAFTDISNIGPVWGRMRLGTTMRGVYIAPATRRSGGSSRPTFGTLLLKTAMLPARDQHQNEILNNVEDAFESLVRSTSFH